MIDDQNKSPHKSSPAKGEDTIIDGYAMELDLKDKKKKYITRKVSGDN